MKMLSIITVGIFAFAVGNAYAGGAGGCAYGKHSAVTADTGKVLKNVDVKETTDPKLLALLKKQAAAKKVETASN